MNLLHHKKGTTESTPNLFRAKIFY
jgi:hypothetical protein